MSISELLGVQPEVLCLWEILIERQSSCLHLTPQPGQAGRWAEPSLDLGHRWDPVSVSKGHEVRAELQSPVTLGHPKAEQSPRRLQVTADRALLRETGSCKHNASWQAAGAGQVPAGVIKRPGSL